MGCERVRAHNPFFGIFPVGNGSQTVDHKNVSKPVSWHCVLVYKQKRGFVLCCKNNMY